ncbi:hypothetical protein WG66_004457 [Moniliophthora roreri]|nr:hypothetical protein WG66_004457 [Moniliophthora roreri]
MFRKWLCGSLAQGFFLQQNLQLPLAQDIYRRYLPLSLLAQLTTHPSLLIPRCHVMLASRPIFRFPPSYSG